jgi:hypothetical protein
VSNTSQIGVTQIMRGASFPACLGEIAEGDGTEAAVAWRNAAICFTTSVPDGVVITAAPPPAYVRTPPMDCPWMWLRVLILSRRSGHVCGPSTATE